MRLFTIAREVVSQDLRRSIAPAHVTAALRPYGITVQDVALGVGVGGTVYGGIANGGQLMAVKELRGAFTSGRRARAAWAEVAHHLAVGASANVLPLRLAVVQGSSLIVVTERAGPNLFDLIHKGSSTCTLHGSGSERPQAVERAGAPAGPTGGSSSARCPCSRHPAPRHQAQECAAHKHRGGTG